jgi:hypothetical protein
LLLLQAPPATVFQEFWYNNATLISFYKVAVCGGNVVNFTCYNCADCAPPPQLKAAGPPPQEGGVIVL